MTRLANSCAKPGDGRSVARIQGHGAVAEEDIKGPGRDVMWPVGFAAENKVTVAKQSIAGVAVPA
jgi:hypothetical protein